MKASQENPLRKRIPGFFDIKANSRLQHNWINTVRFEIKTIITIIIIVGA